MVDDVAVTIVTSQRLGQLISNAAWKIAREEPFYVTDEALLKAIAEFDEELNG
jgi:hypothetical protein